MRAASSGVLPAGVLVLLAASVGGGLAVGEPAAGEAPVPPERPHRIVSTSLPSDEVLLALLPPERIVAVSSFADDPVVSNCREKARRVPHRVRGFAEPILALRPDVVFTFPFARPEGQALLRRSGVAVVHVQNPTGIADIRQEVLRLGRIVNRESQAGALVSDMDRTLRSVRRRVEGAPRPRVLLYNTSGYTPGSDTPFDDVVTAAGGVNVAAEAGLSGQAPLPATRAIALDPDVVLVLRYRADARSRDVAEPPPLADDPIWRHARAVREGRAYEVTGRHVLSTSHHVAEAARYLAGLLHPDRPGGSP